MKVKINDCLPRKISQLLRVIFSLCLLLFCFFFFEVKDSTVLLDRRVNLFFSFWCIVRVQQKKNKERRRKRGRGRKKIKNISGLSSSVEEFGRLVVAMLAGHGKHAGHDAVAGPCGGCHGDLIGRAFCPLSPSATMIMPPSLPASFSTNVAYY